MGGRCLHHPWAVEPLVPGTLSPSTSPQTRTRRPWESSVPCGQAQVGSAPGPCADKDVAGTGGSGSVLTSSPPARVCGPRISCGVLCFRVPSKRTRRDPAAPGHSEETARKRSAALGRRGAFGSTGRGWGCCLGPEHWPLRGCRARPGPPLGVGPDTIRALSLQPQARPSLHLVQRPRQPARGSPAQLAGTPGARPQPAWTPIARLREAHLRPGADRAPHPEGLHQSGCQETPALATPDRASCRAPGSPGVPPAL